MNLIGALVADRALEERRNIVTEIIGADYDETKALIDAMTAIGYHVEFVYVSCDFEQAVKWNLERGDACVSAYYAEPFHRAWLLQAAAGIMNRGG